MSLRVRASLFLSLSLALMGFACAEGEQLTRGKEVYMSRCKMCHGEDGQGNEAMARILNVEFKAMDSEYVQEKDESEMKKIIMEGKGKMAAVRGLKAADVEAVIAYVRSLNEKD